MKRFALLLAAVVLFTPACDDDPAAPSNLPLRFTSDLRAANEVPAVTNADSGATGTMTLTINVSRDASNTITGVTSSEFQVTMSGFPAGTVLTGAHIHPGAAGATGNVLINTGLLNGEMTLAGGSGSFTKSPPAQITVEQAQNLVNGAANFYFNVHTQLNPGGAIRGQLVRTQ
jgi:hypothetical protein